MEEQGKAMLWRSRAKPGNDMRRKGKAGNDNAAAKQGRDGLSYGGVQK